MVDLHVRRGRADDPRDPAPGHQRALAEIVIADSARLIGRDGPRVTTRADLDGSLPGCAYADVGEPSIAHPTSIWFPPCSGCRLYSSPRCRTSTTLVSALRLGCATRGLGLGEPDHRGRHDGRATAIAMTFGRALSQLIAPSIGSALGSAIIIAVGAGTVTTWIRTVRTPARSPIPAGAPRRTRSTGLRSPLAKRSCSASRSR